jgi:hypothetical protein
MKIFLDDIREPPDNTWDVARSYEDALFLVEYLGFPDEVSFDHDLGTEKTGLDFAHFLIELDLDTGAMPVQFTYRVHSANPVGRANIEGLLSGYLRFRRNRAAGAI